MIFGKKRDFAPEIVNDSRLWINSGPLSLSLLRGNVVVLHFWSYTNSNCLRTIPALKELYKRYHNRKCMFIGIHTPEFEFEKEFENVEHAVKKHEIPWPVLQDREGINWQTYGNTYWPRCAVIGAAGEVVFNHVGESSYDEIERHILRELVAIKEVSTHESIHLITEAVTLTPPDLTHEMYFGSRYQSPIRSQKTLQTNNVSLYVDPHTYEKEGIYLQGEWEQTPECLIYKGAPGKGWIALRYYASEVNVLAGGDGVAALMLDERPLTEFSVGKDVSLQYGQSHVRIEVSDTFNLVKTDSFHTSVLKIYPFHDMKLYACTFAAS